MVTKRKPSPLRAAREAIGWSQERTAVTAGISVAWLRQLERDPSLLTDVVAAKLLPVLHLDASEVRP
jgi:transcriptional regulator with XRE-family HTH domain